MTNYDEVVFYCVTRSSFTDLPSCNPGKMAAQVSHAMMGVSFVASQMMIYEYTKNYGYGTSIVLSGTLEDILELRKRHKETLKEVPLMFVVEDPTYPFIEISSVNVDPTWVYVTELEDTKKLFTRKEITCVGFLGTKQQMLTMGLDKFNLHP